MLVAVSLQHQRQAVGFQFLQQRPDVPGHLRVRGHRLIRKVRLANGGHNVPAAKKRRQPDVLDKIADACGIHQVAVPAHGEGGQPGGAQLILNLEQARKGHIRRHMLRPALGGRELYVTESGGRNALNGLLDGVAVIAVGVTGEDARHIGCSFLMGTGAGAEPSPPAPVCCCQGVKMHPAHGGLTL